MKRLDFLKSFILLPIASKVIIDSSVKISNPIKVVNNIPPTLTYNAGMKVSEQALTDIKWLGDYISSQMTEDFLIKEDNLLLYGTIEKP